MTEQASAARPKRPCLASAEAIRLDLMLDIFQTIVTRLRQNVLRFWRRDRQTPENTKFWRRRAFSDCGLSPPQRRLKAQPISDQPEDEEPWLTAPKLITKSGKPIADEQLEENYRRRSEKKHGRKD
jgi:hypothetical protein